MANRRASGGQPMCGPTIGANRIAARIAAIPKLISTSVRNRPTFNNRSWSPSSSAIEPNRTKPCQPEKATIPPTNVT